ncbi:MAG: hypothetical protein ACTS5F_00715 [Candidatus Hodgkinia cicadicola]
MGRSFAPTKRGRGELSMPSLKSLKRMLISFKLREKRLAPTLASVVTETLSHYVCRWALIGVIIDGAWSNQTKIEGIAEPSAELIRNLRKVSIENRSKRRLFKAIVRSTAGGGPLYARHFVLPTGARVLNPNQYVCAVGSGRVWRAELTFALCEGRSEHLAASFGRNLQGCRIVAANVNFIERTSFRIRRSEVATGGAFVLELTAAFAEGVDEVRSVAAALSALKRQLKSIATSLANLR